MAKPRHSEEKSFQLILPTELHRRLKIRAAQEGVSITSLIIRAIQQVLAQGEEDKKGGAFYRPNPQLLAADHLADSP